jgi:hypothetical protein
MKCQKIKVKIINFKKKYIEEKNSSQPGLTLRTHQTGYEIGIKKINFKKDLKKKTEVKSIKTMKIPRANTY